MSFPSSFLPALHFHLLSSPQAIHLPAMAPSHPPAKEGSPASPPPPSTSKVTSSSLLHLLADASSELPSRIGSSYHLSPNPPAGLPSPTPGLVTEASGGKKRKADQDGTEGGGAGKKEKGKQPAAGKVVLSCQVRSSSLSLSVEVGANGLIFILASMFETHRSADVCEPLSYLIIPLLDRASS